MRRIVLIVLIVLGALAPSTSAFAQTVRTETGTHFGGNVDVAGVPGAPVSAGYGGAFGTTSQRGVFDLKVIVSRHELTGVPFVKDGKSASYVILSLDYQHYVAQRGLTKPWLLAGFEVVTFTADEAATDTAPVGGDVSLRGVGLRLGFGIDHYTAPKVVLTAGVAIRLLNMRPGAFNFAFQERTADKLSGAAANASFGLRYIL